MCKWILATALAFMLAVPAYADGIKTYPSEEAASKACRSPVVWANPNSAGVYHVKGAKFYGNTKEGAWVCQAAADAGGWHAAKNGQ